MEGSADNQFLANKSWAHGRKLRGLLGRLLGRILGRLSGVEADGAEFLLLSSLEPGAVIPWRWKITFIHL